MRVLQIVTAYPRDERDVITPWLASTLAGLRAEGIEPEVLAPSYRGSGESSVGGIRVHRFRYALPARLERLTHEETTPDRLGRNPAWALLVPGYVAAGCFAAAALQRRRSYSVVHVHWPVPHGVMGLAARAAGKAGLVSTFYGAELRWTESRFAPASAFLRWYCRRGALVAISSATASALRRYTRRPVHVVPYPSPFPVDPAPLPPAEGARRPGPGSVLFVGRLVARKGVAALLRAAAREGATYRVVIVGTGPEAPALRRLARDLGITGRVELTGPVGAGELSRRYREADVFALPATMDARGDTEGLGVVLLEALSHGVPVVATRRGGIPDIVTDGETGLLVEDGDLPALDRAIRRLLDDRELARRLATAGAERVARDFSVRRVAARLAEIYRAATGVSLPTPAGAEARERHAAVAARGA
ncbi:MAG: glycosyltransferase family 4 protein [Gemmatimonadetes bacterium]|nr:glycosyltransferase family 4 protein [Gemmatimonadota bacterium]